MTARRQAKPGEVRFGPSLDPCSGLVEGDYVMLGHAAEQASHWTLTKVLWTGGADILVEQRGAGGSRPYKDIVDLGRVRCFGTPEFCEDRRREAEKDQLGVAEQLHALQDMITDVRRAVDRLIAATNQRALAASRRVP